MSLKCFMFECLHSKTSLRHLEAAESYELEKGKTKYISQKFCCICGQASGSHWLLMYHMYITPMITWPGECKGVLQWWTEEAEVCCYVTKQWCFHKEAPHCLCYLQKSRRRTKVSSFFQSIAHNTCFHPFLTAIIPRFIRSHHCPYCRPQSLMSDSINSSWWSVSLAPFPRDIIWYNVNSAITTVIGVH